MFRHDLKLLLGAQVIMQDNLERLSREVSSLSKTVNKGAERMDHLDDRVDKLVSAVGEIVRRIPLPPET